MRWLGVVLASCCACTPPEGPPTGEGCPATRASLDFGEVPAEVSIGRSVRVGNHTGEVLTVSVGAVEPPFVATPPSDFELTDGAVRDVTFRFAPPDARTYSGTVQVTFGSARCTPMTVTLAGAGLGTLQFPQAVDFGPVPLHQATTRHVGFTNSSRAPITFTPSATAGFTISNAPITVAPLSAADLEVTVAPESPGVLRGSLDLNGPGFGGSIVLRATLGLPQLVPPPDVTVAHLPAAVAGAVTLIRDVRLANVGEGELTIASATLTPGLDTAPGELRVSELPASVPAGSTAVMRLELSATALPGPRSFKVTLLTDEPARPRVEFTVTAQVEVIDSCFQKLEGPSSSFTFSPPYPKDLVIPLHNPNPTRCLVDDLRLRSNAFGWVLQPAGDQLFVEAGQTVPLTLTITAPGADVLQYATAASPFGYSLVPVNALP